MKSNPWHARCLVGVEENERRIQLAKTTIANALSVRALEELIREARNPYIKAARVAETTKPTAHKPKSAHIQDLEVRFATALSTRVQIVEGRNKDSGRIVIEYYTLTDFDRLAQAMGINLDE
jgi:ParB family chromosome partitioning protein